MKRSAQFKTTRLLVTGSVLVAGAFIAYTFMTIYFGVQSACRQAQDTYRNDCVLSLLNVVQSDEEPFRQKNTAIWALGQLADKRALPVLHSLYTGEISGKESLDTGISQYELKKAIRWCEEGNITSWMYRSQTSWN